MGRAVYEDDTDDSMQGGPEEGPAPTGAGDIAGKGFVSEPTPTAAPAPTSFKSAFAAARAAGDKTFEFNGKKFTTELASSKTTPPAKTETKVETKAETKPESKPLQYQSLQDREIEAEKKRRESGRSFYGTTDKTGGGSQRDRKYRTEKMAKGGVTASRRADGIAQRGKTRGKMC